MYPKYFISILQQLSVLFKKQPKVYFLISVFALLYSTSIAQDYLKMASDLQKKYKESEAAILNSELSYEFQLDNSKTLVKVSEEEKQKFISLRYNYNLVLTQVQGSNTEILEYFASSSLKQKAPDVMKTCGNYTQDGLFYDDSKFCYHTLKLKELGEIWDVTLHRKINDGKYLTTIFFEEKYPILEKKISFIIPAGIEVEIKEFNFKDFAITKSEKLKGGSKVIEFTAKNLPGLLNSPLSRGLQYNHPHLLILLKSYENYGRKVQVLSTTKDLYNWYSSLTKQLKPKPEVFKPLVQSLIKDKKTDEDKIKAIYYWVQDNIRYIAFEDGIAGFKPDEAHNVFEKKYGDCKGMANLTKEMLKAAGFDARLTWIGTKRIMYDYSIPSLAVDNHMICTVILQGKKYFLDATEKYIPFGSNADRIQNRQVLIEDGDNFILDKVAEAGKATDMEFKQISMKLNNDELSGTYKVTLKGEQKKNFLYSYHYTKNEKKEDYVSGFISEHNKNVKVTDLKIPDLDERSGPLDLECSYSYNGGVSLFNNEYYIDIDPVEDFKGWEVKDDRQNDIDFGEKIFRKSVIQLQVPDGFKVAHLPENLKIDNPDFSFSINYKLEGNKISYIKEMAIGQGVIKKSTFPEWNNAVKQLSQAYDNQIIFKK